MRTPATVAMVAGATIAALAIGGGATAQHGRGEHGAAPEGHAHPGGAPGAGHERAAACAREFEEVVRAGRGFGMAFAADEHGYPGPLHVLELADRLRLDEAQRRRAAAMLQAMLDEARPRGARLLAAEERLKRLFARGRADEAAVRAAAADVERARTELRLVHLLTHLRARDLLTEAQRAAYVEARWRPRPDGG